MERRLVRNCSLKEREIERTQSFLKPLFLAALHREKKKYFWHYLLMFVTVLHDMTDYNTTIMICLSQVGWWAL